MGNSIFTNNRANKAGGAIYFLRSENESLILADTELSENHALYGGALFFVDFALNQPDLLKLLLFWNKADDFGSNLVQPPY